MPQSLHNKADAQEAADFLRRHFRVLPRVAILTGTGLGDLTQGLDVENTVEYQAIPHFPVSTVESHQGRLQMGQMAGQPVAVLQGRFHLYEGYCPAAVTFAIRVLRVLGAEILILTNASGGLNPAFNTGEVIIIADHINLTGANPLIGPNEDEWGPRFPDMTSAYDVRLQILARQAGAQSPVQVRSGVYAGLKGPSLETPAEMRFLRTIGADIVGFSTVLETIAAVHAGMRVLGLSTVTNMCMPDVAVPASVEEIIAVAKNTAPGLAELICGVLVAIDAPESMI